MSEKTGREKTVTVLMGNEILRGAAKKVLHKLGYRVRTDLASCANADFAIIGAYFLLIGVVKHVKALNPLLPLVLVDTPHAAMNGDSRYFYGIIDADGSSEMD